MRTRYNASWLAPPAAAWKSLCIRRDLSREKILPSALPLNYDANLLRHSLYLASCSASTWATADREIRIFTADDPVSAIFKMIVSPSIPLMVP
jgi:hypothetical protein